MPSPIDAARAALDYLKGKENPFESLARPQRMDDHFLDLHVPELLANERKLLLQVIDRYRVEEFTRAADLMPTRVVMIRGKRGSGKTHLLKSLSYREDGKSQILVRPSFYDVNLPFEEYLLSQLVATLLAEDEVFHSRPIEDIAGALAPRLLRQAIQTLGPTDRVFALSPNRWQRWRLLLGGADRFTQVFEQLAAVLENVPLGSVVRDLIRHHGLSLEQALRLTLGHVQMYEKGPDLLAGLRRELYAAMARAVLLKDSEPLFHLLEGGYTQIGNGVSTRLDIVARMLHALTEVCTLVRQPIVFAFDNLEGLFSPNNRFDGQLTRAFWNTLAQAIDNSRGLLILLFAEDGLFQQAASFMDSFASDRLRQGVPIFGRGPVSEILLNPPSASEIKVLIEERVGRYLEDFPCEGPLTEGFPFSEDFVRQEAIGSKNLRLVMSSLRDEYSRQVYAQTAVSDENQDVNWENLLEREWKEQLTAAGSKMASSLTSHLQEIHAGLGNLLRQSLPLEIDNRVLMEIQPDVQIGEHPNYGRVSLLTWAEPEGSESKNGAVAKVGVGFLLAKGAGMPADLRAKFDFFRRPAKGDHLLILWPAQRDGEDLVELLPAGTRSVWNESKHKNKTTLRRLEQDDLGTLLALSEWLIAVPTLAEQPVPLDALQAFAKEHFQSLFQLISPPAPQLERIHADEN